MNVRETDVPTPGGQDVLIKVKSAALNPVDYKIIGGGFKLISPWILGHPPKVPGCVLPATGRWGTVCSRMPGYDDAVGSTLQASSWRLALASQMSVLVTRCLPWPTFAAVGRSQSAHPTHTPVAAAARARA